MLSTFSESFLASLYFTPEISAFLQLFFGAIDNDVCKDERQTMVKCVPWDQLCFHRLVRWYGEGYTFGDLMDDLLDGDIMPFGILRTDIKSPEAHRFTMAVPAQDTELFPTDYIYIMYKMKSADDQRQTPHPLRAGHASPFQSTTSTPLWPGKGAAPPGGAPGGEVELAELRAGRPKSNKVVGESGVARRPPAKSALRGLEQRGQSMRL